jgi:hypothetical protein
VSLKKSQFKSISSLGKLAHQSVKAKDIPQSTKGKTSIQKKRRK